MKTLINNEETPRLEFFKRILYSFQVLIVGIAIPVLFFLGISTREDQKKAKENEMSISANSSKLTASSAIDLSIKGI
jgi:hypothetical protein